ncbi:hypothetical protein [Staphylococcus phage vB_SauH_DELF3]|nr:hypothetical protein [Staphylococcus phage vB_SauH_DELF3]
MTEFKGKVGTNKVKTKDVTEINGYKPDTYEKLDMEQSIGFQIRAPYLISDLGIFIAQYLEKSNAVCFYKESTVLGEVKQIVHVRPLDIEHGTKFIEEDDYVDPYNGHLHDGDIIIYFNSFISVELSASVLPHVSFREDLSGFSLQTLSCIPKIVYIGISTGGRGHISFDVLCTVTGGFPPINGDGGWNNDTFTTAERPLQ